MSTELAPPPSPAGLSARGVLFLLFCVGLPLTALGFELLTHASLSLYFDPIPDWLHVLLIASVPAAILYADVQRRRGTPTRTACAAAGFAAGVAAVYTLLYLPILPFSLIGVIWFGIGLLPFAPLAALIGALLRGLALARALPRGRLSFWGAAAAALALLALLELPGWMLIRGLETESVATLERWGSRNALLRAAQSGTSAVNLSAHLRRGSRIFSDFEERTEEQRRNRLLFYRVTGEDPAELPPPRLPGAAEPNVFGGPRRRSDSDAPQLSLASSRIDAAAFADEGVAYLEWTLVFQNHARFQQEARAELLLPPGGVVTRANLWVDGQEREAAFGARAQVREAYEAVVSTRRDPLLVTSDRPGEASIRAFPVPAEGDMRVRIGVSVPLELAGPEQALLRLPAIRESNFATAPDLAHSVWLDSSTPIRAAPAALAVQGDQSGAATARGELPPAEPETTVTLSRSGGADEVWTSDTTLAAQGFVRQRAEPAPATSERWIVVLDGSFGAEPYREDVAAALAALPRERIAGLLVAADEPLWLLEVGGGELAPALEKLRGLRFRGGRDNLAGLEAAWDRAFAAEGTSLLWLCAAQPLALRPPDALLQRLERRPETALVALPLTARPNALLDALPHPKVRVVRAADLRAGIASLGAASGRWRFVRERLPLLPEGRRALPSDHVLARNLSRLWANDEALRRIAAPGGPDGAAGLAAAYHVVTPVSGAVVLETDAQYTAAGLPIPAAGPDGSDVPVVPEPGTGLLLGLGLAILAAQRRRARRAA